jgi:hypothetical protein
MWFCVNKALYPETGDAMIVVVKSLRRFKPPSWVTSLKKDRSVSEVVKLGDLGVVLKGDGREFIRQYYGKWLRKEEFLEVMWCALLRSYKSLSTVERMMKALREFVDKPLEPKPPRPRRPRNVVYELPPVYPSNAVARRARRRIRLPFTAYIYVFSKTIHVVPYYVEHGATVVIPLTEDISYVEITERGLNTLREVFDNMSWLEDKGPEIARVLKLVATFVKLFF